MIRFYFGECGSKFFFINVTTLNKIANVTDILFVRALQFSQRLQGEVEMLKIDSTNGFDELAAFAPV
jgi:hypothetical protein